MDCGIKSKPFLWVKGVSKVGNRIDQSIVHGSYGRTGEIHNSYGHGHLHAHALQVELRHKAVVALGRCYLEISKLGKEEVVMQLVLRQADPPRSKGAGLITRK